jgi:hypothetical protein
MIQHIKTPALIKAAGNKEKKLKSFSVGLIPEQLK